MSQNYKIETYISNRTKLIVSIVIQVCLSMIAYLVQNTSKCRRGWKHFSERFIYGYKT